MRSRYPATLLLAVPYVVAMAPAFASPARAVDITVSRSMISPEQVVMHVGERVRLNVTSVDGAHAFHVKGFGVDSRIPAAGATVVFDLKPTAPGMFQIECLDDTGGSDGTRAQLVVKE